MLPIETSDDANVDSVLLQLEVKLLTGSTSEEEIKRVTEFIGKHNRLADLRKVLESTTKSLLTKSNQKGDNYIH